MAPRKERHKSNPNPQSSDCKNQMRALHMRDRKCQVTAKQNDGCAANVMSCSSDDLSIGYNGSCETTITVDNSPDQDEETTCNSVTQGPSSNDARAVDASFLPQCYLEQNMTNLRDHNSLVELKNELTSAILNHDPERNTGFSDGTEDPEEYICKTCGRATRQALSRLSSCHFLAKIQPVDEASVCSGRCGLNTDGKTSNKTSAHRRKRHRTRPIGDKTSVCNGHCGLNTDGKTSNKTTRRRKRHRKVPMGDKESVCNGHCGANTDGKTSSKTTRRRKRHRKVPMDKKFECAHCGHRCTNKKYIEAHILAQHLGEKPYACDLCEFRTALQHSLIKHTKLHTDVKLYSCDVCSFETNYGHSLKLHKRGHSGEKPYACELCEYKSIHKQGLINHKRTHTGERNYTYPCNECDYIARDSNKLRRHQLIHSGEKPYPCSLCSYRTNQRSNLTVHMKVHGYEKPKKEAQPSALPPIGC